MQLWVNTLCESHLLLQMAAPRHVYSSVKTSISPSFLKWCSVTFPTPVFILSCVSLYHKVCFVSWIHAMWSTRLLRLHKESRWPMPIQTNGLVINFNMTSTRVSSRRGDGWIPPIFRKITHIWNAQGRIFTIEYTNSFSEFRGPSEISSKSLENFTN